MSAHAGFHRAGRQALRGPSQHGAALLMAMLTVALVASLAAAALWRQWRGVEVEAGERGRLQAQWILSGALDWGRLILRQDARSGNVDHLAEPWAIPLAESRLSTFLSNGNDGGDASGEDAMDAFLTGYVIDLQGRLNAYNLIENGQVSATTYTAFQRLFSLLGLRQAELDLFVEQLQASLAADGGDEAPIAPKRVDDFRRLGLGTATLSRLSSFVTWLPSRTTVNLNTAPREVLYASIAGLDQAGARKIEEQRSQTHFTSISQVQQLIARGNAAGGEDEGPVVTSQLHGVRSSYFQINGQIRLGQATIGQQSTVMRNGTRVRVLDRQPLASLAALQAATAGGQAP